jgi:glutamyl/glutaminyl-tRNA synthetase
MGWEKLPRTSQPSGSEPACGNIRASMAAQTPRFRFAPSPTGALHIGGARTALYNWLAARHTGGELVLRIEDTDRERSTPENVAQILDALSWLELDWDVGPVSQASRAERHAEALQRLLDSGAAYRDSETWRPGRPSTAPTAATAASQSRSPAPPCGCACPTRARRWSMT